MVKPAYRLGKRLIFAILPGLLLTGAGCYSQQVVSASGLSALATQQSAPRLALQEENGAQILVGPGSRVRFARADGTYTPWMRAGELWISDEGVLIRHCYPLETMHEIQIAGLDPDGLSLLLQSAPAGGNAVELGQGTVLLKAEGGGLAKWVRSFVVALARQRLPHVFHRWGYDFALRLDSHPAARVVRDLRRMKNGDILGRWGLAVRADEWNWLSGQDLLRVLDQGLDLLDGLRFSDLQTMEVERYDARKTAAAVGTTTLAVVTIAAVAVTAVALRANPGGLNIGGGGDPGSGDPHTTGSSLWIAPFLSPSPTSARPLLARYDTRGK